MKFELL